MKRLGVLGPAILMAASALQAQADPRSDSLRRVVETAPLFASHAVLELRIAAPLATILDDRDQESEYHPGTLAYVDDGGDSVVRDIRAKTRGQFRLQSRICNFPNLHLSFALAPVEGTVFAGLERVTTAASSRRGSTCTASCRSPPPHRPRSSGCSRARGRSRRTPTPTWYSSIPPVRTP